MLIKMRKKIVKAQASLEYAALIGVVVAAIILISTYMKRSVEGKLRSSADEVGDQYDVANGTYHYDSSMVDPQEVTYTAMGTESATDPDLGTLVDSGFTGYNRNIDMGQGVQAQYTEQGAARHSNERITTQRYH